MSIYTAFAFGYTVGLIAAITGVCTSRSLPMTLFSMMALFLAGYGLFVWFNA